jgi:hypothetical protein
VHSTNTGIQPHPRDGINKQGNVDKNYNGEKRSYEVHNYKMSFNTHGKTRLGIFPSHSRVQAVFSPALRIRPRKTFPISVSSIPESSIYGKVAHRVSNSSLIFIY